MVLVNKLPFGGFRNFVATIKEIVESEFPERTDIIEQLDQAIPSTEFGINGLGMREEFTTVAMKLQEQAMIVIADGGPETTLGGYMASAMAAKHSYESSFLQSHLELIERNKS